MLLHLVKLFVVFSRSNLETVLGLGLGGLEGARENKDLCIFNFFYHLRVRKVFINDDTCDKGGVFEGATSLGDNLDVVKVNIATIKVSNCEDSLHSNVCHMILALAHDLGAKSGSGAFAEELVVILLNVNFLLDCIDSLGSNIAGTLKSISNLEWVNTLIEKLLSLIKESTGKDDNTSCSITDFIVLRLRKLDEEACSLMLDFHLFDNGCTVIGNDYITVRALLIS